MDTEVLRILDAAINRATEGLRVVEDHARFALDDSHLTRLLKQLRHDLTSTMAQVPALDRLLARDTQSDVGTTIAAPTEYDRTCTAEVLLANFQRVQQALRCIEEFSKIVGPELAARLESFRYRTYTLQKAVSVAAHPDPRLQDARLCVLVDGGANVDQFTSQVQTLLNAGANTVQLRAKNLADRELIKRGRRLREISADHGTVIIVNDRADIADLVHADGVHLGQDDLSVKEARSIVGTSALIGVSTHSLEQARQAALDGANYIGVGPTFPSGTKQFSEFTGTDLLRQVLAEISLPAFAIGGINLGNVDQVLASGFTRIAVSGGIWDADSPAEAVRQLMTKLDAQ